MGDVSKELGIECEYRRLPGYQVSQFTKQEKDHADDVKELKEEVAYSKSLGMDVNYRDDLTIKGWNGKPDQRDGIVFGNQATFHPTKYLLGVLKWLSSQPNFTCHARTRVADIKEKGGVLGLGHKEVDVITENGHTVHCKDVVSTLKSLLGGEAI